MSEIFARIPNIGELYYNHIYLFYDEPQLFSCITKAFQYYFAMLIDSDDNFNQWLLAPISNQRLLRAEKNTLQIKDIFVRPETDFIWNVRWENGNYFSGQISPESLTADMLPEDGQLLDYNLEILGKEYPLLNKVTKETPLHDCERKNIELRLAENTPYEVAVNERRDVIDLSLELDDGHLREISCTALSEVLEKTQQLFYAIGYKNGSILGPIPKTVKQNNKVNITNMFAASVGIRLKSDDLSDINFETPLTKTLSEFNFLFSVADDPDKLKEYLAEQSPRVAFKYRSFIKSLLSHKIGIKIDVASPNNSTFNRSFTTKELTKNLELVESKIEEIVQKETLYGTLVGINADRGTFEFVTVSDDRIHGTLSPQLMDTKYIVRQQAKIVVEEKIGIDSLTKNEKILFTMIQFEPISLN